MSTNNNISQLFNIIDKNLKEYLIIYDFEKNQFKHISSNWLNLINLKEISNIADIFSVLLSRKDSFILTNSLINRLEEYKKGNKTLQNKYLRQNFSTKDSENITNWEIHSKIIENDNSIYFFINVLDITEHKKTLEEKEKLIKHLNKSHRELERRHHDLHVKNQLLNDLIIKDDLTGVYNRYYFDNEIKEEVDRNDRYHSKFSLILFDIDKFKNVNDTYGHDIGDQILITIAGTVKDIIKKPDTFARWGGEEFVILLPQTSLDGAYNCAERIRKVLENITHSNVGRVTSSFGVIESHYMETPLEMFKRVDELLYLAKQNGRNRVEIEQSQTYSPVSSLKLSWSNDYNSGNKIIDIQHRYLLTLMNRLNYAFLSNADKETIKEMVESLTKHTKYHFNCEEKIIKETNYNQLDRHKLEHEKLIRQFKKFYNQFLDSTLEYEKLFEFILNKIVWNHLIKFDKGYFDYL